MPSSLSTAGFFLALILALCAPPVAAIAVAGVAFAWEIFVTFGVGLGV